MLLNMFPLQFLTQWLLLILECVLVCFTRLLGSGLCSILRH
jgi:hypothetical protein